MNTMTEKEKQEALAAHWYYLRKKKWVKRAIIAAVSLVVVVSAWGTGFGCAKNKAAAEIDELENRIEELVETPVALDAITPEIVQKTLSSKIEDIRELASAEYIFTNAAKFTDSKHIKNWKVPLTQKGFVQKWDGIIKAGVKLDNIGVTVAEKTITITLPQAEILSYEIDHDSVEVLDEKNNVFNPISVDDKVDFDKETEAAMKERAIANGLLKKAQANAENIIAELLEAAIPNADQYTIEFKTAE